MQSPDDTVESVQRRARSRFVTTHTCAAFSVHRTLLPTTTAKVQHSLDIDADYYQTSTSLREKSQSPSHSSDIPCLRCTHFPCLSLHRVCSYAVVKIRRINRQYVLAIEWRVIYIYIAKLYAYVNIKPFARQAATHIKVKRMINVRLSA